MRHRREPSKLYHIIILLRCNDADGEVALTMPYVRGCFLTIDRTSPTGHGCLNFAFRHVHSCRVVHIFLSGLLRCDVNSDTMWQCSLPKLQYVIVHVCRLTSTSKQQRHDTQHPVGSCAIYYESLLDPLETRIMGLSN